MNKKIKKILSFLIVFMLMIISVKVDTKAAGGLSISASASEVSSGGTFTVTVNAASNYFVSNVTLSVSGGTVVSGLGKTSLDRGETTSAKIKLTGENCVVSVSGVGANYDTETEETASASVTVKKKASTTNNNSNNNNTNTVTNKKSKDNTLSTITVSEGTLSPEFNSSTTEYSVAVNGATEKIALNAKANHAKATVSGTGEKAVVPGHNQFAIVCTAENGNQKTYTVDVYVDETPLVYTTYNNQKLGVVRNQTDIGIPTSFEETTVSIDGQQVQAYHSNQFNMTLVYLVSESENKNFYIYEDGKGITSIFRPVSILGRNVIVYDLTEEEQIRENMVYSEVTIDGTTLYGWTYENPDFSNYIHIMVINEFGEKIVYQYEKTENSLQLYKEYVELEETVEENVEEVEEKTIFPNEYYMYAIVGLSALSVILLIAMIYFIASRKARHEGRKRKAIKKQEKQKIKEEKILAKQRRAEEKEQERQWIREEKQRRIEEREIEKQRAKEEKRLAKENR